jgi:hypothetical protein
MTPIDESQFGAMQSDIRHIREQLAEISENFKEHLSRCDSRHRGDEVNATSFQKEVVDQISALRVEIAVIKTKAAVIGTIAGAAPCILAWIAIATKLIKL